MWGAGLLLVAIGFGIVGYMAFRGVQYLRPSLLFSHPQPDLDQSKSGGFLDPLLGTVILTVIGIAIATPLAVAIATWIVEYGARRGSPASSIPASRSSPARLSIVIALFGLVLFQQSFFGWISFTSQGGAVFGRSFLTAGAMMALIALPLVFGATREGLHAIPPHVREASYALGKTAPRRSAASCCPPSRANISTGAALGMGRIAGDTAIVVVLLGATLQLRARGVDPRARHAQGTGSTLTSYVYNNSPAGEGTRREGLRGGLRAAADRHRPELRRRLHRAARSAYRPGDLEAGSPLMITDDRAVDIAAPGADPAAADPPDPRRPRADRRRRRTGARRRERHGHGPRRRAPGPERMSIDRLSVAYGDNAAVKRSPSRSALARSLR